MSLYLNTGCGSLQVLIDVNHVMEVLDVVPATELARQLAVAQYPLAGHFHWREQLLHVIHMPCYLGLQDIFARRMVIVDTALPDISLRYMALAFEKSEQLLTLDDSHVADMAEHHDRLLPMFEGIYSPENSSACQLVLRFPATWIGTITTGIAEA